MIAARVEYIVNLALYTKVKQTEAVRRRARPGSPPAECPEPWKLDDRQSIPYYQDIVDGISAGVSEADVAAGRFVIAFCDRCKDGKASWGALVPPQMSVRQGDAVLLRAGVSGQITYRGSCKHETRHGKPATVMDTIVLPPEFPTYGRGPSCHAAPPATR